MHPLNSATCPECGKNEVQGDSIEIDGNHAVQDCSCLLCGATWTDHYDLTHRGSLETGAHYETRK